jgi:hypothetical protein
MHRKELRSLQCCIAVLFREPQVETDGCRNAKIPDFEQTNFQVNVRNTMLQLIDKYIDCFAKNNKAYGVSQKVSKYKQYVKDLNDDL